VLVARTRARAPISLLEALSYGVTPVCSDIPELWQIITNGFNGYLFKKGNYKQLAYKIENLIMNYELRTSISNAGRLFRA
jgi:glycosyltransferase involved in cell wall biosynthesis